MADQPDRIRVWNEETREMLEPETIQAMLRTESNNGNAEGVLGMEQCPADSNKYEHLVFMRNTGIYAASSKEFDLSTQREIFSDDLITKSTGSRVYRVVYRPGQWWAIALLYQSDVATQPLNHVKNPTIVGNIFENKELVMNGWVIDG